MRKQNGITLIALVISIIVMLILAGVSINAIVGENGVLSRAQYSSFLNEMAAVEEAVQLWKAGELIESKGQVNTAIPANGLWETNNLIEENMSEATKRLIGEIGYYRVWSIAGNMPENNILSVDDSLYNAFKVEFVGYPAGVQDLYYLNNEALGLDEGKVYLIDATTSMVYSMTGISINGVRCYSTYMAKALMGNGISPVFAEAEVSGAGTGGALAGNVQEEFLPDGSPNPEYNPNGFKIIGDYTNYNVYKLYNNGELYGKGIKGPLLNTPVSEMEEINQYIWKDIEIPNNIPGAETNNVEIVSGVKTIYIIDANKDLWAWGNNESNKLGLTQEEQISYTGRDIIKLNIFNKKVYKVFGLEYATYVITINEEGIYELYGCGYNTYGELGIGNLETTQTQFNKIEFDNPENIKTITAKGRDDKNTLILTNEGKLYFAGLKSDIKFLFDNTNLSNTTNITKFKEICNGVYGTKFESKIIDVVNGIHTNNPWNFILTEDGNLYKMSATGIELQNFNTSDGDNVIEDSGGVQKIFSSKGIAIIKRITKDGKIEFWAMVKADDGAVEPVETNNPYIGTVISFTWYNIENFFSQANLNVEEIKNIFLSTGIYVLDTNDNLYYAGENAGTGIGIGITEDATNYPLKRISEGIPKIKEILNSYGTTGWKKATCILLGMDNKYYITNDLTLMYKNDILQQSWARVASNVKKFYAVTNSNNMLAYIDKDNDLWILGNDARKLGLNISNPESISNFVRMKDYLKNLEIYDCIDKKVEDYQIATSSLYIKTTEEDNNALYVCSSKNIKYVGLPLETDDTYDENAITNYYIPIKLLDDVKMFKANSDNRIALKNNDELWVWGRNDGNSLGSKLSNIPYQYTDSNIQISAINKIFINQYQSYISEKFEDNSSAFWVTGINHVTGATGLNATCKTWTNFNLSYFGNKEVMEIVSSNGISNYIVLTNEKTLYGWGIANRIGIGRSDGTIVREPVSISTISDIVQITAAKDTFIVVTSDGKVYGTGSNQYGILGRWIGIDRDTPNSRYKTAFDWVECPELEI